MNRRTKNKMSVGKNKLAHPERGRAGRHPDGHARRPPGRRARDLPLRQRADRRAFCAPTPRGAMEDNLNSAGHGLPQALHVAISDARPGATTKLEAEAPDEANGPRPGARLRLDRAASRRSRPVVRSKLEVRSRRAGSRCPGYRPRRSARDQIAFAPLWPDRRATFGHILGESRHEPMLHRMNYVAGRSARVFPLRHEVRHQHRPMGLPRDDASARKDPKDAVDGRGAGVHEIAAAAKPAAGIVCQLKDALGEIAAALTRAKLVAFFARSKIGLGVAQGHHRLGQDVLPLLFAKREKVGAERTHEIAAGFSQQIRKALSEVKSRFVVSASPLAPAHESAGFGAAAGSNQSDPRFAASEKTLPKTWLLFARNLGQLAGRAQRPRWISLPIGVGMRDRRDEQDCDDGRLRSGPHTTDQSKRQAKGCGVKHQGGPAVAQTGSARTRSQLSQPSRSRRCVHWDAA